jgi:hypothetical protein
MQRKMGSRPAIETGSKAALKRGISRLSLRSDARAKGGRDGTAPRHGRSELPLPGRHVQRQQLSTGDELSLDSLRRQGYLDVKQEPAVAEDIRCIDNP